MPLIKSTADITKVNVRVRLPQSLLTEIQAYMEWAKVKKLDSFLQQAAERILSNDKEWRDYKNAQSAKTKEANNQITS